MKFLIPTMAFAAAAFVPVAPLNAATDAPSEAPSDPAMPLTERGEVLEAVDMFFAAIRNSDKTALSEMMVPEGMIFIHNRMNPQNTAIITIPVPDHLAVWQRSTAQVDEVMTISSVNIERDMAHVWGPYRFIPQGRTSHCGVNSLSLVKTDNDGWKVANTSFSMIPPSECAAIGAPEMPQ